MKIVVRTVQFLFAAVFIFSGLAKCVDPAGTSIKVTEYLQYFGFGMLTDLSMGMAWLLCIVEFICGVNILLGHARHLTLVVSSLLLLVFTPLTLWLALTDAISECGCFGDAVHLTNWQTFGKNLILIVMLALLWTKSKLMYRLMGHTYYVFYSYYALGLAVWLCWMGRWRDPFIDFRPFTPGTNLREAVMGEGQEQTSDSDTEWVCIYQRNGVRQEFSLDNLPDEAEGWEFVETIERHADGKVSEDRSKAEPKHIDFFVKTADGEIITDELLSRPGYTLLLLSRSLDKASQHDIDRIELLSEYAGDNDYGFLCLTARDEKQLERWKFNTGAEYPFVFTDASIIETMCRSNPAVMLLRDGVICWKTPLSRLDAEGLTSGKLNEQTSGDIEEINYHNRILLVLFLLFAPFFLFLLVEILQFLHKQTLINNSKKMRKKIVAGNWKMNTTLQEGVALAEGLKEALAGKKVNCDVVVCTPFISVASVAKAVEGSVIGVGAEDCSAHEKGAYTGEVAANMIASTGAKYVILGHSERRQYHGENNELLVAKLQQALANGLTPIFCVGEVKEERVNGTYKEVIEGQMEALYTLSAEDFAKCVVAYEPVWAIGTGLTATSEQAEEVHAFIRASIAKKYDAAVADNTSILYGGSCKGSNAPELFAQPDIDGGLIGGAALKVDTFMPIIEAWK